MVPRLAVILTLALTGKALADETRFLLLNGTEYPISELALSASQLNNWGANVLRPPAIKPGEVREVTVPSKLYDCHQDLKTVFANNASQPIWQYVNLCDLRKIRLRYDATSGITTATYEY
jgi:hypothetical protein